jgi:LysM repeat protein
VKKLLAVFFILLFAVISANAKLTQPKKKMSVDYTVQSGDTLYKIAHDHHTTIKEVLEANGFSRKVVIKAGQSLKVPLNTYSPDKEVVAAAQNVLSNDSTVGSGTVTYTVQNGDTLFTIARNHHTSIKDLLKANNMDMRSVIKVGQSLTVPLDTYFPNKKTPTKTAKSSKKTADIVSPVGSTKNLYVVKRGDTLFSIARKNHIVISKLMKLNKIGLGDALHTGQVLKTSGNSAYVATKKVPKESKETKKKKELPVGAMPSYTVKKGDTLWKIARKHHLTLAEIRKLNKMRKKDRIHTGMVLAVGRAVQPKSKTYKVKKGDTLWLIAKKNNINIKKLRKINHMHRRDHIHTGMVLALAKGVKLPKDKQNAKDKAIAAKLRKKGVKKSEIKAVLARVKKSKKKNPSIAAILAQIKKEKKKKRVESPLRIVKKKKSKKRKNSRFSSAASILNGRSSSGRSSWSGGGNSKVIRVAKRYLGRRYVWGAVGPRSFDCSGFTQYVMRKSKGVRLPRVSRKQAYYGRYVSRSHLRPGDLIFFDTSRRRRGYVNHVGIYIGNNKFIHASSGRHRVVITSLNRPFYRARFKWGRRVN